MNKLKIFIFLLLLLFAFSCNKTKSTYNESDYSINNLTHFADLKELQGQLHSIADNQTSSVVSISTEKIISQPYNFDPFDFFFRNPWGDDNNNNNKQQQTPPKNREFKQGGLGSGVIYQKKDNTYYIMTNNHVIENVDKIKVVVNKEKNYDGKVLGTDPDIDIAVVEIKTSDQLLVAKCGDSDKIRVGDFVTAIGNPFGLQGTMTFGIISALGRSNITDGNRGGLTNFIQTDAAINPGNSGGPLSDLDGEVIGINTLIYSQSGGNVGIGFAIPINIAKKTADQIISKGKVEHGWLGVYFEQLTEDTMKTLDIKNIEYGLYVKQVIENSPADKAGIKTGDILLALNDKKLAKTDDLIYTIGNATPGTKVKFKISREGKTLDKEVVLGDRTEMKANVAKENESLDNYGMRLVNINDDAKKEYKLPNNLTGVIVTRIDPRGLANQAGIQEGDVIYKINNKNIKSINEIKEVLKNDNTANYFFINRKGKELIIKM